MGLIAIKFIGIGAIINLISVLLENTDRPDLAKVIRIIGFILMAALTGKGAADYYNYSKLLHQYKALKHFI